MVYLTKKQYNYLLEKYKTNNEHYKSIGDLLATEEEEKFFNVLISQKTNTNKHQRRNKQFLLSLFCGKEVRRYVLKFNSVGEVYGFLYKEQLKQYISQILDYTATISQIEIKEG